MRTHSQTVADHLRKAIQEGELAPGTRLEEVPLGEHLKVSRTPVRAALATLTAEGLLTYVPKRGFEVRQFSIDEIIDVYRVRTALEAYAASECAARGVDPELLAILEQSLVTGDRILAKGRLDPADLPEYREMNARFHGAIIQGSGSSMTAEMVLHARRIPLASDRIVLWHDYGLIERSHDDHHRLVDAIRKRQPDRAAALMREHIYFMAEVVRDYLSTHSQSDMGGSQELPSVLPDEVLAGSTPAASRRKQARTAPPATPARRERQNVTRNGK